MTMNYVVSLAIDPSGLTTVASNDSFKQLPGGLYTGVRTPLIRRPRATSLIHPSLALL